MFTELFIVSIVFSLFKGISLLVSYISSNIFPQPLSLRSYWEIKKNGDFSTIKNTNDSHRIKLREGISGTQCQIFRERE